MIGVLILYQTLNNVSKLFNPVSLSKYIIKCKGLPFPSLSQVLKSKNLNMLIEHHIIILDGIARKKKCYKDLAFTMTSNPASRNLSNSIA